MVLFYALRPKQWIKNFFVLIPLFFGQKVFESPANGWALAGFVLFCMASSAVYLINDVIDLESDRLHRKKRLRPIAAGKVTIREAQFSAGALGVSALVLAAMLDRSFMVVLLIYMVANLLYAVILKHFVILDVFCVAAFFLLRVIGGAVLIDVQISHWLLFMVVLLAMFLTFNKRRQELGSDKKLSPQQRPVLADYDTYFLDQMTAVLTGSIVVVYMLYTIDARTVAQFGSNHLIYTIPFVYYGVFRYLYLVHKKKMGEDPAVVLLSDKALIVNLLLWGMTCVTVVYGGF